MLPESGGMDKHSAVLHVLGDRVQSGCLRTGLCEIYEIFWHNLYTLTGLLVGRGAGPSR